MENSLEYLSRHKYNFINGLKKSTKEEQLINKIMNNPELLDAVSKDVLDKIEVILKQKKKQLEEENIRLRKEIELKEKKIKTMKCKKN